MPDASRRSEPPGPEPVDLTLHMGSGKTGTSSVQFLMNVNRERLARAGWLYPSTPGRARHVRLGLYLKSDAELERTPAWRRQRAADPEEFRSLFRRRLGREIAGAGLSRVLLSDEALFGSSDAALRRLRALADDLARRVTLVVYLRRQDDHLVSRYQQAVKVGAVHRLSDRLGDPNLPATYDYAARLHGWQRILAPQRIVVRRFEPGAFEGGSLYQDFLRAVGIDVAVESLEPVETRNESLDAEAVELLRLLNLLRREGTELDRVENRELVTALASTSTGPTLTLPERDLDGFMARWEASNRAVATEFLGDDEGPLFHAPRKIRHTTTEQRLDPARVGHYGDLLGLPGDVRAALRRVAEREAAR